VEGAAGDVGVTGGADRVGEFVDTGLGSARVGVEDTGRACGVARVEGAIDVGVAVADGFGEEVLVAVGAGGSVGIKVGTALGGAGRCVGVKLRTAVGGAGRSVGIEVRTALGGAGRCVGIKLGTGLGGAGREAVGEGLATGLSKAREAGEGRIGEGVGLEGGDSAGGGVGTFGIAVASALRAAVGVGEGDGGAGGAGVGASIRGPGVGVARRATITRGPHATAAAPAATRQARVQAEGLIFISLYGSRSKSLPSGTLVRSHDFPEGHRTVTRSATLRLPSPK
jgi:hypothetical protein